LVRIDVNKSIMQQHKIEGLNSNRYNRYYWRPSLWRFSVFTQKRFLALVLPNLNRFW